jgi:NAD(P)-dependent dehydrogenase (short-subunit alcohol dehydrogenase family)
MTTQRLAGKVVIITGGTSGIGKHSSLLLAREGAKVAIGARNDEAGNSVARTIKEDVGGEALFVQTDVTQPEDVESLVHQTVQHFGRLDVLYANSGVFPTGTAPETSIETWQRCLDTNLGGQFYLAKYGIPALVESGGGVIIFTASELGTVGISDAVAYCAAKGGLINMARAVAIDCAPYGIRVNCLAPGPVETPMLRDWIDASSDPAETERAQTNPVLLKRFGRPEEIAEAALFLASDASSFMTGAVMVIDGGATAWYGL